MDIQDNLNDLIPVALEDEPEPEPVPVTKSTISSVLAESGVTEEQAAAIGCNFGGGMKCGGTCGAITGALMVLGTKGVISPAAVGEFRRRMAQKHNGMTDCAELLKANAQQGGNKKTHCDNMIYEAIELLDEMTE